MCLTSAEIDSVIIKKLVQQKKKVSLQPRKIQMWLVCSSGQRFLINFSIALGLIYAEIIKLKLSLKLVVSFCSSQLLQQVELIQDLRFSETLLAVLLVLQCLVYIPLMGYTASDRKIVFEIFLTHKTSLAIYRGTKA